MLMLELSLDEGQFLRDMLARHLAELRNELVHTEQRRFRKELGKDVDRLQALLRRIEGQLNNPVVARSS